MPPRAAWMFVNLLTRALAPAAAGGVWVVDSRGVGRMSAPGLIGPDSARATGCEAAVDGQIHMIRGVPVMLDFDLASLYGVATGVLLQSVRRNRKRFPADFMFSLSGHEVTRLRSQIVISSLSRTYGGRRCGGS